jgi:hypothetical protein
MSKSNASAKSRRAFISPPVQANPSIGQSRMQSPPMQPPTPSTSGLTLQQVISVLDKRIVNLEMFVNESKEDSGRRVAFEDDSVSSSSSIPTNLADIISEFNSRFELFAEEINNMKDIVLKLQTYTMDVNKTLMEERINILSDLGTIAPTQFDQTVGVEDPVFDEQNIVSEPSMDTNPSQDTIDKSVENLVGQNYRRQRNKT